MREHGLRRLESSILHTENQSNEIPYHTIFYNTSTLLIEDREDIQQLEK
jgi:hypothetical protein